MTTATQAFTGQPMGTSIAGPQGTFGPGFPSPIGAEQIFGMGYPQVQFPYPSQTPQLGQVQPWLAIAAQIAPLVQQAILPYVISTACQQVLQLLPQVVAQAGVHPGVLSQQYQVPWQGQGFSGQAGRPYSYLP
jgi:hypothetical protein